MRAIAGPLPAKNRWRIVLPALLLILSLFPSGGVKAQNSSSASHGERVETSIPLGFSRQSYTTEQRWERLYLAIPDAARCGKYLRRLTAHPHVAGTIGDKNVTQFIYDEFKRDRLRPQIVEYRVLLSYPKSVSVELLGGTPVELANPEPAIPGDKSTRVSDPMARMPWNAYSPSADLTAPVIYVNYGTADDYDRLAALGVIVKGKIVLARYFHGYRGGKSLEAEQRGAAGVIVFSDPADDGARMGKVYPHGPWGPLGHFQRGSVVYDFNTPGDPLTPGWASTDAARRIAPSESKILPKIPMVPLSAADAVQILARLEGPAAPGGWQGGLPLTYRIGEGNLKIHLALQMENRVTPIWDVIGRIPGSVEPEKTVILSNHHDAWVYGAVDPGSGTAAMLETARAFGELVKAGYRPRRTIVFGSWDAEEYTLTGSTEWGEEHETELRKNGVVCLNVDSATSGQNFTVSMVPALLPALIEAAKSVKDPATSRTFFDRWQEERGGENVRRYGAPSESAGRVPFGVLGGGSDFMVFLQHDGVPSLDMIFDGPYGVYHSLYDDYDWMARFGDPGFHYHAAMARIWGLVAMRFADADLLPFDYSISAAALAEDLQGLKGLAPNDFFSSEIQPLITKSQEWRTVATGLRARLEAWRRGAGNGAIYDSASGDENSPIAHVPQAVPGIRDQSAGTRINKNLMAEERAWLNDAGLPGRPWFRHMVYAPLPSYDPETLPGLREALEAKDLGRARREAERLNHCLQKAIDEARGALQPER